MVKSFILSALATVVSAEQSNIVELAESVKDLSTLVGAVVAADLVDTLSSPGPFTVFAPTNEGFGALPSDTLDDLMKPENKAQLVDVLTYHVLPEQVLSHQLRSFQRVKTVEGQNVHIYKDARRGVRVTPDGHDFKNVKVADNVASNGVVHIIDGVLIPPSAPTPPPTPAPTPAKPNIVELAESVKDLSTLVSAVVAGDLVDTLSSSGPFTVFAPTNAGFNALPSGTLDSLMKPENKAQLVDILTFHVLPQQVLSTDLQLFQAVTTVEGKPLHVQKWGGEVRVGPSLASEDLKKVTTADNLASNGVVHIIDGVLLPPSHLASHKPNIVELAESVKDLSTLVAAVVAGDLVDTLSSSGPFTVFAPTNAGFNALPAGTLDSLMKPENKDQLVDILTYHVIGQKIPSSALKPQQGVATVEGKTVQVFKDAKGVRVTPDGKDFKVVTSADNEASNGVVHIIDGVLIPTTLPNIVELAETVKDLSTLVAAVVAGDLVDTLSSPGLFTVFAPTNDAFGKLPAGTLDSLMKPENKAELVDILKFHVVPEQVKKGDLTNFQAVTTVEGKPLHVVLWGGVVRLGPSLESKDLSTVTAADNAASNGIVHIIDGVLLPPAKANLVVV